MILPPVAKQCPRCKLALPRDDVHFSPHRRKNGVVTYDLCRPCAAERSRERYRKNMNDPYLRKAERRQRRDWERRNPRKVKAINKRKRKTRAEHYAEQTATPEGREAILGKQRMDYALRKMREGQEVRSMTKRKGSSGLYVRSLRVSEHFDPEPFRTWIDTNYPDTPYVELAKTLHVNERTLTAVMTGQMLTVSIRFVDRACVSLGRPDLLEALYPLGEVT